MLGTTKTCPARHHFRTHGVRHALATLAFVAGGGLLPLVGAAASTLDTQPAPVEVQTALPAVSEALPATLVAAPVTAPLLDAQAPQVASTRPALAEVKSTQKDGSVTVSGRPVGVGEASFYGRGDGFAGRKTANGEVFDPSLMTAAHKTLPLGTRLKVTNLGNQRSIVVRVNDRGPYAKGRILDLSYGAAQRLGMVGAGHARVKLERV